MPEYTSIRAATATAAMLRDLTFTLTGQTRRRVSQSEALHAACTVALMHLDEAAGVITGELADPPEGETR